jgi:replication-associated recombination protein RarA
MSLFDGFALAAKGDVAEQGGFDFPEALTEKYRPRALSEFAGLEKQKTILANFAAKPFATAFLFVGASGTGKTTMGMALASAIPAELHHIPSQDCTLATIQRTRQVCQYVPAQGYKMHLVLVDEADQMSAAAQIALLSQLDATNFPPSTVFVFTCNSVDRLEQRFLSRCKVLEFSTYGLAKDASELLAQVWRKEKGETAETPNFARLVKESNNNVRESLNRLETEMLSC